MNLKKCILTGLTFVFVFTGCANNGAGTEFNKPALYWYKKMGKSISNSNLDKADAYYVSLRSEHLHSPLMPTAIMMLAHAHMNEEEYLLANRYLDEYNKRFGEENSREYTDFMKLKAHFLGVKDVYKDQKLIMDSIATANRYLVRYPSSAYAPLVNTLLIRLHMSQYLLNENIAALYDRTGKPDAAEIYRDKNSDSVVEMTDITPPEKGIIGKIFD
jgi:outer membrane protein assembly factor BamD